MKKLILLILSLAMLLSLCACGSSNDTPETDNNTPATTEPEETTTTKEDLLAEAISFTREDLSKASSNEAFASSFVGNVYIFEASVDSIEQDYAVLGIRFEDEGRAITWAPEDLCANVYLSLEELVSLEPGQILEIVGKISDMTETSTTVYGNVSEGKAFIFDNVFITKEYFETTGILKGINDSYEGAWDIKIGDDPYLKLIYFADGVDLSEYDNGTEITFMSKRKGDNRYIDATIIE